MMWNNGSKDSSVYNSGKTVPNTTYRDSNTINTNPENIVFNGDSVSENTNYTANRSIEIKNGIQNKGDYPTVSVFDVAKYILEKLNKPCSTMKLQKLVYYCQAWFLVWEDRPLFDEKIEAWSNGPVIRRLFNFHRGSYSINKYRLTLGSSSKLSELQKEDINSVLNFYGGKSSQWLIDQTHSEQPWIQARVGLAPFEKGDREISRESMVDYYSSLS